MYSLYCHLNGIKLEDTDHLKLRRPAVNEMFGINKVICLTIYVSSHSQVPDYVYRSLNYKDSIFLQRTVLLSIKYHGIIFGNRYLDMYDFILVLNKYFCHKPATKGAAIEVPLKIFSPELLSS